MTEKPAADLHREPNATPAAALTPPDQPQDARQTTEAAETALRATTFTYLAVWAYLVVTVMSVSHRQLLIGTTIQLPILNVGVSIDRFFLFAPMLFLLLHWHALMQIYAVAQRRQTWSPGGRERRAQDEHSDSQDLAQLLLLGSASTVGVPVFISWMFRAANWLVYVGLPLVLFLSFQLKFLPYQSELVTATQFALVLADLLLVWSIWPRLGRPGGRWRRDQGTRRTASSLKSSVLAIAATFGCVLVALGMWFDQRPLALAWAEPFVPSALAEWLDYRWSKLELRDTTLMQREPDPDIVARFRSAATFAQEPEEVGTARAFVDRTFAEPLDLSGRSLRRAELRYARMYGVLLRGTDLRGADLQSAVLTEAQIPDANLGGANLVFVQLQHATACVNEHTDDEHCGLSAVGANLSDALLQGARLTRAVLTGALLTRTKLNGADLTRADLRGADLAEAQLRGAMLCGAQLQAANLDSTNLAGADLAGSATRCDSEYSLPHAGQAADPCAEISHTNLFHAELTAKTDLRFADLRGTTAQPPLVSSPPCATDWIAARGAASMPDWSRQRLAMLATSSESNWRPAGLPVSKVEHTLVDSGTSAAVRALVGSADFKPQPDIATYIRYLGGELRQLACDGADPPVTQGIIRRMWRFTGRAEISAAFSYVPCLASAMRQCALKGLRWYEIKFLEDQGKLVEPSACAADGVATLTTP